MELQDALMNLEEPAGRIENGINAIGIMALGLSAVSDPYAPGFHALWNYLAEANRDFQKQVRLCINLR